MCETHKYSANYRVFLRQRLSEIEIGGVDILKKKWRNCFLSGILTGYACKRERERESTLEQNEVPRERSRSDRVYMFDWYVTRNELLTLSKRVRSLIRQHTHTSTVYVSKHSGASIIILTQNMYNIF